MGLFAQGLIPDDESEALELHVGQCACCEAVFDAECAPIIQAVRINRAIEEEHPEGERIEALIRRVEQAAQAALDSGTSGTVDQASQVDSATEETEPIIRPEDLLEPPQSPDEIGRLGRYRVFGVLGQGGMGVVFRGEDPVLKLPVALKVIKNPGAQPASLRERLLREARGAAALSNDHVVKIWHVDDKCATPFIAMELLKGESLAARLRREPRLPLPLVLQIGREVASGLAAAHAHGLIHRDLKPENIWLEARPEGMRVRILDFGLALDMRAERMTSPGMFLGTAQYTAPEQARGDPTDARSDLFSLGVVLYQISTGKRPFEAKSMMGELSALENRSPPPPREIDPSIPSELSDLIMRLIAKRAQDRPESADELLAKLREMAGTPAVSRPRRGFSKGLAWAAGIAALCLAADLIYLALSTGKSRQPPAGAMTYEAAVREGLDQCKDQKEKQGLLWLARALELAPVDDQEAQWYVRMNLAAWSTQQNRVSNAGTGFEVSSSALSPDGSRLFTTKKDNQEDAICRDVLAGSMIGSPMQAGKGRQFAAWPMFTADGLSIFAHSGVGKGPIKDEVLLFDVKSGEVKRRFPQPEPIYRFTVSPAADTLLTASLEANPTAQLYLWNVADGKPIGEPVAIPSVAHAVAFSEDGKVFAAGSADGKVRFWKTATQESLDPILEHDDRIRSIAFSPDGKSVLTVSSDLAAIWETTTGRRISTLVKTQNTLTGAFSRDGRLVAVSQLNSQWVRLFEAATGRPIGPPASRLTPGGLYVANFLAFTPNGEIYLAGTSGYFSSWKLPTPLEGTPERITCWAEVTSHMRLDEGGRMHPLDDEAVSERRRRLETLGGVPKENRDFH
jgi:WD40 repeat protein